MKKFVTVFLLAICAFSDVLSQPCALPSSAIAPPSPVSISQLGRKSTYTNVLLNGGTNSIVVAPGTAVALTGNFSMVYDGGAGCSNCITQHHIGLQDGATTVFTNCHGTGGGTGANTSGSFNVNFNAPTTPGVYYITQVATWWYYCGQFGVPSNTNIASDAIAVVSVLDNVNPQITCPGDMTVNPTSLNGAVVNYTAPVGTDNCTGAQTQLMAGFASGATFPIGATAVTYKATDASGNQASCTFNVTVRDPSCDNNAKSKKVNVCHNGGTLCVSINALQAHLDHGDQLGSCEWTATSARGSAVVEPAAFSEKPSFVSYPNPVSRTTHLQYTLPLATRVNIRVFDLMGREVAIVFDGDRTAGTYVADYNTSQLATGTYYARMSTVTGGKEFVKTQILVKIE